MVDVLRKPPEVGTVGLAAEWSLQPCGLCQVLLDSSLAYLEQVATAPVAV